MFNRVINFVRNIRIKMDFPQYEKKCRIEHERLIEKLFSTKHLESEKNRFISRIQIQADNFFKAKITERKVSVSQTSSVITDIERNLSYFTRYYKQELNDLYEKKKQLFDKKSKAHDKQKEVKNELVNAFKEKDSAYESLNYYKNCIDSWHSKSKRTGLLFGNKGKKLPNHSFFGQSFGDLESCKYDRDSAYSDVVNCKKIIGDLKRKQEQIYDSITSLKQDIGKLINRINKIKKDRSHMYEMKNSGYSKNRLQSELAENIDILRIKQAKLKKIELERIKFIDDEKIKYGVFKIDSKIKNLNKDKFEKINEFDHNDKQQSRIKEHRLLWLKERNLA